MFYILIVVFIGHASGIHPSAVNPKLNFSTLDECNEAGRQTRDNGVTDEGVSVGWTCVPSRVDLSK